MYDTKEDKKAIQEYKDMWKNSPYPVTFVTSDMFVFCNSTNSILLIKRGGYPGKGLWALPGGFLDQNETTQECAYRELKEETGLDLSIYLKLEQGEIFDPIVFDEPNRDPRGRFITHVYSHHFYNERYSFNKVKKHDDAGHVEWVNIDRIKEMTKEDFFADHYKILMRLIECV